MYVALDPVFTGGEPELLDFTDYEDLETVSDFVDTIYEEVTGLVEYGSGDADVMTGQPQDGSGDWSGHEGWDIWRSGAPESSSIYDVISGLFTSFPEVNDNNPELNIIIVYVKSSYLYLFLC